MFTSTMIVRLSTVCLILLALLVIMPQEAMAAGQSADQELAQQTGLGSKKFDESKMPGKLQYGIAIGSVIAMFAAFKYL